MKESIDKNDGSYRGNQSVKKLNELLKELDLNISSNPRGTDKGDPKSYVHGFYETEFSRRQFEKNRLLEIGVRTGASLALWANYFENVEIFGADVEDIGTDAGPVPVYLNYPSINFFCSDAYSQEFAQSLCGSFSIIIDDGPHSLVSQKRFLELYLPKLEEDGVLIIEDIQRDYRDCHQLMKALPKGNKFVFEVYDFRAKSKTGDDFLFVVRHNKSGESYLLRKNYIKYKSLSSWTVGACRRIKRLFCPGRCW